MCGRCDGEPFRGVAALFNGDLQSQMGFADREDWLVASNNVIVHIGKTSLKPGENYLIRDCDIGYYGLLWPEERAALEGISSELNRPLRALNPNT